jgi:hypothetical protein
MTLGLDGSWASGSYSRTDNKGESWWQVDLGEVKEIRAVQMINAKDSTCGGQVAVNEDCGNDNLVLDWSGGSYTAREQSSPAHLHNSISFFL